MKFPGVSLEKTLNLYLEEFTGFDRTRDTLYLELRKPKTTWLFDLDSKDSKSFIADSKLLQLYANTETDAQWVTNYAVYFKVHNSTPRDYFDPTYPQF